MWFHMLTRMNADYEKAEKSLNQVLDEYGQSFADY
jgi:hypothetical protein